MGIIKKAPELLSEEAVKQALDIPDFRHMTKEKTIELVSFIPQMDKEAQLAAIKQVPELAGTALKMAVEYKETVMTAFAEDDEQTKKNLEIISAAVDVYTGMLQDENVNDEVKLEIIAGIDKLVEQGKGVQKQSQDWKTKVLGGMAVFSLTLFAGILTAVGTSSKIDLSEVLKKLPKGK